MAYLTIDTKKFWTLPIMIIFEDLHPPSLIYEWGKGLKLWYW